MSLFTFAIKSWPELCTLPCKVCIVPLHTRHKLHQVRTLHSTLRCNIPLHAKTKTAQMPTATLHLHHKWCEGMQWNQFWPNYHRCMRCRMRVSMHAVVACKFTHCTLCKFAIEEICLVQCTMCINVFKIALLYKVLCMRCRLGVCMQSPEDLHTAYCVQCIHFQKCFSGDAKWAYNVCTL